MLLRRGGIQGRKRRCPYPFRADTGRARPERVDWGSGIRRTALAITPLDGLGVAAVTNDQ